MIPDRRTYSLSQDQPILREARRHRKGTARDRDAMEAEFWKNFNLDKLARDWKPVSLRGQRAA